jgi:hypothetical protein
VERVPPSRCRAPPQAPPNPAVDQAQELIYGAWDCDDPRREVAPGSAAHHFASRRAAAHPGNGSRPANLFDPTPPGRLRCAKAATLPFQGLPGEA